jgi:5-methylthioadenosine/S-adenosylhomocysteine deaminase
VTQIEDFLESGMPLGIGIDSNALAGSSEVCSVMKLFQLIEAGRKRDELAITPRRLLVLATIEGAKSIGMGDKSASTSA